MSHHLIVADKLAFAYPDGTGALSSLSFTIKHGEAVGVVGANGAGKSTLLMLMVGALLPTGGTLNMGGYPLSRRTLPQIRRSVGMIFQDPDDQLFMPTVHDDVAFGPLNQGLPPDEVESRVQGALARVGAAHLPDRPPYRLSGGEKRAAAIAAVIAMAPDILVLDEPSAGLDPRARRRLIEILREFEHTKIIATHDLDLVLDLCPRTIVLREGAMIADGSTAEIFADEALLEAGHLEKPLRMQGCPRCGRNG